MLEFGIGASCTFQWHSYEWPALMKDYPQELYLAEKIIDDTRYEGIAVDILVNDMLPGQQADDKHKYWQQPRLAARWQSPICTGNFRPDNDFPCINLILPAFSKRACDVLSDFLIPNGELLPLCTSAGEYYFYNITTVLDALDVNKSVAEFWCDPPTTAVFIEHFEFLTDRLKNSSVFRIFEMPSYIFVTNAFVETVRVNSLRGFCFRKVWPLSHGVDWMKNELIFK